MASKRTNAEMQSERKVGMSRSPEDNPIPQNISKRIIRELQSREREGRNMGNPIYRDVAYLTLKIAIPDEAQDLGTMTEGHQV